MSANTTKRLLAASLKQLLTKKTLDKITVKDITDHCGVNRQTFYYHFQDVYALLEWIFEEELEKAIKDHTDYASWKEAFRDVFSMLLENRTLVLNAYHSVNIKILRKYLIKTVRPIIAPLVDAFIGDTPICEEDRQFIVDIYTFGLIGIALNWIDNNMELEYATSLDKFFQLIDGSTEYVVKKFSQQKN
ncbi:MAG: TetR/AcrR family transcriptional regulator C-terminal domain-containing protein [Oscillospiraceae bacterium]|jgi:probable dihydroxyacetone kinase regulator